MKSHLEIVGIKFLTSLVPDISFDPAAIPEIQRQYQSHYFRPPHIISFARKIGNLLGIVERNLT